MVLYLHTKNFKKRSNGSEVMVKNVYFGPVLSLVGPNLGQTGVLPKIVFCKMIEDHKILHFKVIPAKTNDEIFQKLWKTWFFNFCWFFLSLRNGGLQWVKKIKIVFFLVFLTHNQSIRKKFFFFIFRTSGPISGPVLGPFCPCWIFFEKSFFAKNILPLIRFVLAHFQPKLMTGFLVII